MAKAKRRAPQPTDPFFRQEDLAVAFPVLGRSNWIALIRKGALPSKKIGTAVIVTRDSVEALLRASTVEANA